jgi:putative methyltransferase
MKVLYSNPSAEETQVWLPYGWGRFREYCDHQSEHDLSAIEWLDPIYFGYFDVEKLVSNIDFKTVDVLLCSIYIWNEERQIQIAKRAREVNPNILILAGGPQAQYRPHQNTKIYEVFDYVSPWEGEHLISEILHQKLTGQKISNDLLVDPRHPRDVVKAKRLVLKNFKSPFVVYKEDFLRFSSDVKRSYGFVASMWETNRGCPYKCAFCDWGSATSDKIRKFDESEVLKEIEILGELQLNYVFNADANFGIFKSDLDYIKKVVEVNSKTGYPRELQFSAAKNKKEISNQAHKLLYDAKMCSGAQISFQHSDGQVLEAIDRSNIRQDKLTEELEEAFKNKIPLVGVVILGNPGDTVDKWKSNLGHMLDIGFHHDLRVHDFMLLPNAPAADPEYVSRYGLETARRKNFNAVFKSMYDAEFVVKTHSYSRDDYAEMQTFTYFLTAFHVLNISRFIALFARHYYGIDYSRFYDELSRMPTAQKIYDEVKDVMMNYTHNGGVKFFVYEGKTMTADVYIKCRVMTLQNEIMKDLINLMSRFTPLEEDKIIDMIKAQRLTWVYWKKPKDTYMKYNFAEIFKMLNDLTPMQKSNYIDIEEKNRIVRMNDFTVGAQWKYDMKGVTDFSSWVNSKANHQVNKREGLFHYQQALEL